jgi:hypothetical protein
MKNADDKLRPRYLDTIRDLVISLHRRESLGCRMCPIMHDEPDAKDLKMLAKHNHDITTYARAMANIEVNAGHEFGIVKLLGPDVTDAVRNATCILTSQVLSSSVNVSDIAELASVSIANSDTRGMIEIHEAFVRDGCLRPHSAISLRRTRNIGEASNPRLTEKAFRIVCGLALDGAIEFDEIARVDSLGRG